MKKTHTLLRVSSAATLVVLVAVGGFYFYWNLASPHATCSSCHEIESSSNMWAQSGHRDIHCTECHGTALSNGFHSMKEKGMMLVNHFAGGKGESIKVDESTIPEIMRNCQRCHGAEYAGWLSGGHSATYGAIFLNAKQNASEQLHADCLRCHGMFFTGGIDDLVSPTNLAGPWTLKLPEHAMQPAIPCLTCHKIHREGLPAVAPDYSEPRKIFYSRTGDSTNVLLYDRYEKEHIAAVDLPLLTLWDGGRKVQISDDQRQRLCIQCHAPDAFRRAGSGDDRTPRGVHEGLSCLSCHDSHSNASRQSCINCHPAISNCQRDVTKMNTTYFDKQSPYNIHFVRCLDCHPQGVPRKSPSPSTGK